MSKHHLYVRNLDGDDLNLSVNDESEKKKEKETSSPTTGINGMKQKEKKMEKSPSSTTLDLLSDDSDDIELFKSLAGNKLPYSLEEDEFILSFLLKGGNIFKATSISIWKYLESKKENPKRTYQSLKNRFLRNIKPNIFSTYKYLITNSETVRKITEKFPELEREVKINNVTSNLNLPKRNAVKITENATRKSSEALDTSATTKQNLDSNKQKISQNNLPNKNSKTKLSKKKVEIKNDIIIITVNFNNNSDNSSSVTPSLGIYNKYLNLKNKNPIIPCSYCGRGDSKDIEDEDSCHSESVNFISSSVDSSKKKTIERQPSEKSESPSHPRLRNLPEKRMRINIIQSPSPSLLEDDTNANGNKTGKVTDKTDSDRNENLTKKASITEDSESPTHPRLRNLPEKRMRINISQSPSPSLLEDDTNANGNKTGKITDKTGSDRNENLTKRASVTEDSESPTHPRLRNLPEKRMRINISQSPSPSLLEDDTNANGNKTGKITDKTGSDRNENLTKRASVPEDSESPTHPRLRNLPEKRMRINISQSPSPSLLENDTNANGNKTGKITYKTDSDRNENLTKKVCITEDCESPTHPRPRNLPEKHMRINISQSPSPSLLENDTNANGNKTGKITDKTDSDINENITNRASDTEDSESPTHPRLRSLAKKRMIRNISQSPNPSLLEDVTNVNASKTGKATFKTYSNSRKNIINKGPVTDDSESLTHTGLENLQKNLMEKNVRQSASLSLLEDDTNVNGNKTGKITDKTDSDRNENLSKRASVTEGSKGPGNLPKIRMIRNISLSPSPSLLEDVTNVNGNKSGKITDKTDIHRDENLTKRASVIENSESPGYLPKKLMRINISQSASPSSLEDDTNVNRNKTGKITGKTDSDRNENLTKRASLTEDSESPTLPRLRSLAKKRMIRNISQSPNPSLLEDVTNVNASKTGKATLKTYSNPRKNIINKGPVTDDSESPTHTGMENLQKNLMEKNVRQLSSPGLLEDVTNVNENKTGKATNKTDRDPKENVSTGAPVTESSSDKNSPQKNNSNDFFSETDLNSLFQETITDFRTFMDSQEDERLVNEYFKKNHNVIDTFFMDTDLSDSQSVYSSSELATQIRDSMNDSVKSPVKSLTPLAKNMVKMLNPGGEKKINLFSTFCPPKLKNI